MPPAARRERPDDMMSDTIEPLLCDLLVWIGSRERTYDEVMEAWRTSCPRLPVWEEANDRGFVARIHENGSLAVIRLTEAGRLFLAGRH
jgi:hypothetical protein